MKRLVFLVLALCLTLALQPAARPAAPVARNVLVVTLDGVRWQELFGGAQPELVDEKIGGVADLDNTRARFVRPTTTNKDEARRAAMPFFWTTIATKGQVFGDPDHNSAARLTNGLWFSYPGYNEMLAGHADPRIDSNDKIANPNVTVLEWLNGRPAFKGRVAAFASWELLPYILNVERSHLPANGEGAPIADPRSETDRLLNDFAADIPPYWGATRFDATTMAGALDCLKRDRPRVLYVMLGETDEWGHERRYDLYLDAMWRSDRFVRRLWETAQSMPEYTGRTALIVATDHGRGADAKDWTDHGRKVPAAERIWMAVMGPDTEPLGVRASTPATLSQIAATIAAIVGEDFTSSSKEVAPPLPGVVGSIKSSSK
jgi:hypothetical protein